VLLCADANAASADLASGALACPSCGAGRLRPWGHGRERVIRLRGGARARLSPRRARCSSCKTTHILLPSWMASRRADAVGVIVAAAVTSALHGTGTARIGADLGVPAATVRGWLRRLRARSGAMRQDAMVIFGRLTAGCDAPFPEPSGSALGDALSAVAACAHAAITFCGRAAADLEPLLGLFGLARFLAPAPGS
jgi:transposase-like protein